MLCPMSGIVSGTGLHVLSRSEGIETRFRQRQPLDLTLLGLHVLSRSEGIETQSS